MPRHAMLFAAALALFSLHAGAQTDDAAMTRPSGPLQNTCAKPAYPMEALRNEWTGIVGIAFLIGPDGLVKDARYTKSSGHAVLDEAAKVALSRCQFRPAMVDGKPVQAWQVVQYVWSL